MMINERRLVRRVILLLGIAWAVASAAVEAGPPTAADRAWEEAIAAGGAGIGETKGKSRREILEAMDQREERIRLRYLAFFEGFPTDARRWDAALALLRHTPRFISGWTEAGDPVRDPVATEAWKAKQRAIEAEMAAVLPRLPARIQERFEARPIFEEIGALFSKLERKEAVDWAALRGRVVSHIERFPTEPAIAGVVHRYLAMFERDHPALATAAEWRSLTRNPVIRSSEMIAKRLEVIERETGRPMEMRFTAVDGREVDLAKLRGKVVLIDFWATWCGPCIAELPNVKRVYEAYRGRGFEVIGIALENADLRPGDTPEREAAKHAAAKAKLLAFVEKEGLPWPQHYDGRYWNNEISRGRFNINAIPATFLLDREGMVAFVNIRGPQLETEVGRLIAP
jgi:thiol-disulfide isomerase/thioredoxin